MIEILLGTALGVVLGTASGIIPGVHANTLPGALLSLQVALLSFLGPVALAAAMFAALITHTFVDAIPSTFLGIPDTDTSLAVLPAHALCLQGNGEEAVRIAALGSACAMIIAIPLSVLCFFLLPALQPYFDWWIGILLIATVGFMIVTSESPAWALAIFSVSGILGLFALRYTFLSLAHHWRRQRDPDAPAHRAVRHFRPPHGVPRVIAGAGVPGDPDGGRDRDEMFPPRYLAGVAVGWLPGLSTASANGVLASVIGYEKDRRAYILATNAANTANAFIGLAALFALSRMRNGVMVALSELPLPSMSELMVTGVLAACAAYLITVRLSRSAHRLCGIDSLLLNRAVIAFVVLLCIVLTGPFGVVILLLATATGLVPYLVNVPRVYCMGAIMFPVMLYSFGVAGV